MIPVAEEWSKLANMHTDEADHLAEAMHYWRTIVGTRMYNYQPAKQKSYACECKHCELTLYTSTKRLNCEYCGSSDPDIFECKELE